MSFRTRLLLAFVPLALLPLAILAFAIRREVGQRMLAQYDARVADLAGVIEEDVARESQSIATRLAGLAGVLVDDNRFRRALLDGAGNERQYLLDYATDAMQLTGLDALQIQDATGRILSSGHFRNDFDRVDERTPRVLQAAPGGAALAELRTPGGSLHALLRMDTVRIGPRTLTITGGVAVDRRFLTRLDRGGGLSVSLLVPGASAVGSDSLVREVALPFIPASDAAAADRAARFVITQSLAPLQALRRSIDVWFLAGGAGAAFLALLVALWLAARLSRPIADLARRTQRLDLDRLDVDFPTRRTDELGTLARTLGTLTHRLRASAGKLREAERRATVGDIARQVHHDVRNGLTPIRNVVQHLTQLARESPAELPTVFLERHGTLDASISYLHSLASNYARLSPRLDRNPYDVNEIVREVLLGVPEEVQHRVRAELSATLPLVLGDAVALRRIFENLIVNALESLEPGRGSVIVSTTSDGARVHVVVADMGIGMTAEQAEKIFDDFYTTKERGTGLGLSIVRRLINDLGGAIAVESAPGRGSRFHVELPAAERQQPAGPAASPAPDLASVAPTERSAR